MFGTWRREDEELPFREREDIDKWQAYFQADQDNPVPMPIGPDEDIETGNEE